MDSESFSYAISFKDRPDHSYIYIKSLAQGNQGAAQLVRSDAPGGPLVVRKISRPPVQGSEPPDVLNEVRIGELLKAMALTPNGMKFDKPLIISLLGSHTIKLPGNKWSRESYWSFCNGGTAADRMYDSRKPGFSRPPFAAIGKYVRQVGSSLLFMRFAGPKPVYHHDLHLSNILLHFVEGQDLPDFYIADLGWSNDSPLVLPGFPGSRTSDYCDQDMFNLRAQIDIFSRRAEGNQLHREAAKEMVSHAEDLTENFTEAGLRELVLMGQRLEQKCTAGGDWDERVQYPHYQNFVAVGKAVLAEQSTVGAPCMFDGRGRSDTAVKASLEDEDVFGPWYLLKMRSGDTAGQLLTELGYGGVAALLLTEGDEVDFHAQSEEALEAEYENDDGEAMHDDDDDDDDDDEVSIKEEGQTLAQLDSIPWHPYSFGDSIHHQW